MRDANVYLIEKDLERIIRLLKDANSIENDITLIVRGRPVKFGIAVSVTEQSDKFISQVDATLLDKTNYLAMKLKIGVGDEVYGNTDNLEYL